MSSRRTALRAFWIGTASAIVLSADMIAPAIAQQQQSAPLPPVTVDAPRPQVRRAAPVRRAAASRAPVRRAVVQPLQRQEPVAYVTPSTGMIGAPPAPFAGGQVASGSQVGLLGNRNIFDTPFSTTSFTREYIQSLQPKNLSDIVERDPSVQVQTSPGLYYDSFQIRGLRYSFLDVALNGLYNIVPVSTFPLELFERVEIFKGPSQLLFGQPPGGSLGGVVNLVSKRAPDAGIAQLTNTFWSPGLFGTHLDVGQRFGEQKEWGVRVNALYRNGDLPIDRSKDKTDAASLNVDYRSERLRASFDYYHHDFKVEGYRSLFRILPGVDVPTNLNNKTNYGQPHEFLKTANDFGMARVEADVLENVTVFGAVGGSYQQQKFNTATGTAVIDNAGNATQSAFAGRVAIKNLSAETGVRSEFFTGPVKHQFVVSANQQHYRFDAFASFGAAVLTNIYNPIFYPNALNPDAGGPTVPLTGQINSGVGVADTLSVLNDRIALTIGTRYQTLRQESYGLNTGAFSSANDSAKNSPAYALVVKPLENVSLYANYIEALTQVAPAPLNTAFPGQTFAPVATVQKEVGVKVNWWNKFGTTIAAFDITSPSVTTSPANVYGVLGLQRNKGVELSAFGEITPGVRFLGGIAFLDAKLEKAADPTTLGKKAIGVPDVQASAGVDIDIPFVRGLTFSPSVIYVGDNFVDPANTQRVPSYVRTDLAAYYTFANPFWGPGKPIVIRARAVNVGNVNYITPAIGGSLGLGIPRSYIVSTTFNF